MTGILCPACGRDDVGVTDSRPAAYGIRRRRACPCGERFNTVEVVAPSTADRALVVRTVIGPYGGAHVVAEDMILGHEVEIADLEKARLAERIAQAVNQVLGL